MDGLPKLHRHGRRRGVPRDGRTLRPDGHEADVRGAKRASAGVLPVLHAAPGGAAGGARAVPRGGVRHLWLLQRAGEGDPGGACAVGPPAARGAPLAAGGQSEAFRLRERPAAVPERHGRGGRGVLARGRARSGGAHRRPPRRVRRRRRRAGHVPVRGHHHHVRGAVAGRSGGHHARGRARAQRGRLAARSRRPRARVRR